MKPKFLVAVALVLLAAGCSGGESVSTAQNNQSSQPAQEQAKTASDQQEKKTPAAEKKSGEAKADEKKSAAIKPDEAKPEEKKPDGEKLYDTKYFRIKLPADWQSLGEAENPMDYKFAFQIYDLAFIKTDLSSIRTLNVDIFKSDKNSLSTDDFARQYKNYLASGLFVKEMNPKESAVTLAGRSAQLYTLEAGGVKTYYYFTSDKGMGFMIMAVEMDSHPFGAELGKILASFEIK